MYCLMTYHEDVLTRKVIFVITREAHMYKFPLTPTPIFTTTCSIFQPAVGNVTFNIKWGVVTENFFVLRRANMHRYTHSLTEWLGYKVCVHSSWCQTVKCCCTRSWETTVSHAFQLPPAEERAPRCKSSYWGSSPRPPVTRAAKYVMQFGCWSSQ